jgi:hypothetical protein
VREGAIKYVREQVTDADAVAILSVTNGLQMLQPFTQDKAKLIATLENLGTGRIRRASKQRDRREHRQYQRLLNRALITNQRITTNAAAPAAAGHDRSNVLQQVHQAAHCSSLQQARPVLAALAASAEGLRRIPARRRSCCFQQGFVTPEVLDWQVQSTIDIANRAKRRHLHHRFCRAQSCRSCVGLACFRHHIVGCGVDQSGTKNQGCKWRNCFLTT